MALISKFAKCGGGVWLRGGGKEGKNGNVQLHKQNVSSSHAQKAHEPEHF